jgi:hypothetical protein
MIFGVMKICLDLHEDHQGVLWSFGDVLRSHRTSIGASPYNDLLQQQQ